MKQSEGTEDKEDKIQYKKTYVKVIAEHSADGICRPKQIIMNTGEVFTIDKLKARCRAAATKTGGAGIRYTVVICGRERFLFDEENGRWFVEMRQNSV